MITSSPIDTDSNRVDIIYFIIYHNGKQRDIIWGDKMRKKLLIFLSIMVLLLQFLNLSNDNWITASGSGSDDDAIEIHVYNPVEKI